MQAPGQYYSLSYEQMQNTGILNHMKALKKRFLEQKLKLEWSPTSKWKLILQSKTLIMMN